MISWTLKGGEEVDHVQTLSFLYELFLVLFCQFLGHSVHYSWNLPIQTRLFPIYHYFELQTISLGFALQSFAIAIGYFHSCYIKLVFISPENSKRQGSTVLVLW